MPVECCSACGCNDIEVDESQGYSVCTGCGKVLEENQVVSDISFVENAHGASSVVGQFVPSSGRRLRGVHGFTRVSRELTLDNARKKIALLASALGLGLHHIESARRLFVLALQHNFTQGRRTQHVVAVCLYIVCRREKTPHLLIDFSDVLRINLYILGHTFLKLCQVLNLQLPIVDPSLYIPRFAAKLEFEEKTNAVINTAIRLAATMKRDWINIGRRPAGVCGACLLISSRLHGFRRSQKEIIQVVRVCELTLRKRLNEFQATPASNLTQAELEQGSHEELAPENPPAFVAAQQRRTQELQQQVEEALNSQEFQALEQSLKAEGGELSTPAGRVTRSAARRAKPTARAKAAPRITPLPKIAPVTVENEDLSDLDDEEASKYLLPPEEVKMKQAVWEQLHSEYLKEQAEKQRIKEAEERSGSAPVKVKKPRRKRQKIHALSATQSTAEGVAEVLQRKVSKKINYAALEDLFGEEPKERTIEQVSTTSIGPTSLAVATGEVVATEEDHYYEEDDMQSELNYSYDWEGAEEEDEFWD